MTDITIPRALLEQALAALQSCTTGGYVDIDGDFKKTYRFSQSLVNDAAEAIRAELAKPKEEPVAASGEDLEVYQSMAENYFNSTPSVVWKATSLTGDTAHFGVRSAAKAWARSGTVEPVPLKHLRLVPLGTDCGPDCRQCGMTCRKARKIDEEFAHRLALEIECLLIDPERNRAAAEKTLSAYHAAWDAINPDPATSMGEPIASSETLANPAETSSSPIEDYSDCHGPDWTDRDGEYLK